MFMLLLTIIVVLFATLVGARGFVKTTAGVSHRARAPALRSTVSTYLLSMTTPHATAQPAPRSRTHTRRTIGAILRCDPGDHTVALT